MRKSFFPLFPILFLFLLGAGCFYRLNLEPPVSLKIDPRQHQPAALLPIPDAPGHPHSGARLHALIRASLEEKGYALVEAAAVEEALQEMKLNPLLLLTDRNSRAALGERLGAGLLILGAIPEYRLEKSYLGAQAYQVWRWESYEDQLLPTYHRGSSQIRLILRMFQAENGDLVWRSEGSIRGPGDFPGTLKERLVEALLKSLPARSLSPAK